MSDPTMRLGAADFVCSCAPNASMRVKLPREVLQLAERAMKPPRPPSRRLYITRTGRISVTFTDFSHSTFITLHSEASFYN